MTGAPSAASGAWVDLVALTGDEHVLVWAALGDAALLRLGQRVARMAVEVETAGDDVDRVQALLAHASAEVQSGPLDALAAPGRAFDLVAAAPGGHDAVDRLARLVTGTGRLALLLDNPWSPLRAADRLTGHPGGPTIGRLAAVRRRLERAGLDTSIVFGLLRSSAEPASAFRLDRPNIADTVLAAALVGSGRGRRTAIGALRAAARRGLAGHLVGAWLVIASCGPRSGAGLEPTGRIGVASNEQGAVLLGPGPDAVEKHYADLAQLEAARSALAQLDATGIDVGTRVIGQPSSDRLRTTWAPGQHLDVDRLAPEALARWLGRAAGALGAIQQATLDDGGRVLAHGDFWLGCVVVEGDRITGVIDWTDAHCGDPRTDLRSLVDVIATRRDLRPHERLAMLDAVRRGHERAGGPPAAREGLDESVGQ